MNVARPSVRSAADWSAARAAMFIDPTATYLNTGSYGPLPRVVFERVTELRRQLAAEPVDFLWRTTPPLLWQARERLAAFLSASPGVRANSLLFTVNVTASINIVAASLRLTAPGEVLIPSHEYGSMVYAWERACQRQGLTLRTVPIPMPPRAPGEVVEAVAAAMSAKTRLLLVSHVLYTTGMVMPVRELCAEARRRGILTLIDGAHAPGMIPVNLAEIGCDFYGANCHKWLLAPIGAGFLYIAPGNEDRLQPLAVSWGWHYDRAKADERDDFGGTHRLRSFEFEGTRDPSPWLTVPTAIALHEQLGPEAIRSRHRELTDHVRQALAGIPKLTLVTPEAANMRGALTSFRLAAAVDVLALRKHLWEKHRVEVPVIEQATGNYLRVSTHFYNTEEEVDRLAEAVRAFFRAMP
jgi:isopenicillin-N epimerase